MMDDARKLLECAQQREVVYDEPVVRYPKHHSGPIPEKYHPGDWPTDEEFIQAKLSGTTDNVCSKCGDKIDAAKQKPPPQPATTVPMLKPSQPVVIPALTKLRRYKTKDVLYIVAVMLAVIGFVIKYLLSVSN